MYEYPMKDISDRNTAETVKISYLPPSADPEASSFIRFLKKKHRGPVDIRNEWQEMVGVGCGRTREVTFVVEDVVGGNELGNTTDIVMISDGPD